MLPVQFGLNLKWNINQMRYSATFILLINLMGVVSAQSLQASLDFQYPEAKREEIRDTIYNRVVEDPYRWLEDLDSEEVKAYIKSQDSLFDAFIDGTDYQKLEQQIAGFSEYERYVFPSALILPFDTERGIYYTVRKKGSESNVIYRRASFTGIEELIISESDFPKNEKLSSFSVNKSGFLVAVGYSKTGSNWTMLKVLNTETGIYYDEILEGIYGRVAPQWEDSGEGFYYVFHNQPEEGQELNFRLGNGRIYYHKLGTSQEEDELIYELKSIRSGLEVFGGDRFLKITSNGTHIFDVREKKIHTIFKDASEDKINLRSLGARGDSLYYITDYKSESGCRLISVDPMDAEINSWNEIVSEFDCDISRPVIMQDNFLIFRVTEDVRQTFKIFDLSKKLYTAKVQKPFLGTNYVFRGGREGTPIMYYSLLNLYTPLSILKANLETGKSEYFLKPEIDVATEKYETNQVFYKSKDGTKIPMLVSHKKGIKLNGKNPTILYAYGALGTPAVDYYQEEMVAWLDNGGIYANAGIRGGGEYGREWIKAGSGINKQKGIEDYIYAGKWLNENGYSSPKNLVAYGGSLSGVLPAAAIVQTPDLFAAAMIRIPVVDMIRFPKYGYARNWINEFGDPNDPNQIDSILRYSPYHNIDSNKVYPPVIIQAGENDQTATPFHAYKLTAALQHTNGIENPVFLQVAWGAGHSIGKDRESSDKAKAKALSFIDLIINSKQ